MVNAFENFEEINTGDIHEKHRKWLKQYEGCFYSKAEDEVHKMKWKTERKYYKDSHYDTEINVIQRLKNRTIIEFDGDPEKAKEGFEIVKQKFIENGWGFIQSTHNSKKSDYIWVEFDRELKDKEVDNFLAWICPEGHEIDMNFSSSKKVFVVLYSIHWKYSYEREMPVEYFKGIKVPYDKLNIPQNKKVKKTVIDDNGFAYQTYQAAKIFGKKGQAEKFSDAQPIFYDRGGLWWLWIPTKFKWEIVDEVDILNLIETSTGADIITPSERTKIINSLKQLGRKRIPKDIKPTWIQFKNKIVDIETGEEFDATPQYFVTNPIPYSLGESPSTHVMDKIFEEWVGKENIQMLYEIIAYCMIPDYPINRLFCFIGAGMNGKSKYLDLLRKFIGDENCCSTELDVLLNSRFEVTRLHKKLVAQIGETNFNEMKSTSIIKKLTGGDLIGFEYKNKNPFEAKNYAKIIIATNNLPTTTDKTVGFYRRWMIIDFPNQFTEKKDILSDIPEEEYENLARKSLNILKVLLDKREFHNEGSIEDRMKRYEDKSNPLEKFFREQVEEDYGAYIFKWEFQERLNDWCKEHRYREIPNSVLGRKMKELGIEQGRKYVGGFTDGKQYRAWIGLKWRGKR